jgi:pilus assembly protein CpaB
MILMVVAVVCGLGASYMTSRLLAERDVPAPEVAEVPKVTLIVAKKNLDMHMALRKKPEDFFTEKQFVKDDAPKDALAPEDMAKLKDKYLKRGLRKGDHLTAEDLMDNLMSLKNLPNGQRAIGIRVTNDTTASGFACVPGSHVDIIWTKRTQNDNDSFSKVLIEDVVVLAADTNTENAAGGAMLANVVSVALNQEDVLKVSLAMDAGSLRLVVRNLEDKTSPIKERITLDQLIKGTEMKKQPDASASAEPVEIVRADNYSKRGEPQELPQVATPTPAPTPMADPEAEPAQPKPVLKKMTASVRNGGDVQLHHYWLDENDQVVLNPQQYFDSLEAAVPEKKEQKKTPKDR